MAKRKIVEIDEDKCNGCGKCIPNCHEGALEIVNGKARLVADVYCDGLGNCLGHCPRGAIRIIERDAKDFDFEKTNEHLEKSGREKLMVNPMEEKKTEQLPCSCPGTMLREIRGEKKNGSVIVSQESELRGWPIQLSLLPPNAPFFQGSDLLIASDCVGFADPNIHKDLIKGSSVVIGCPKMDDLESYKEKITAIVQMNELKSVTVAIMEVPCCYGMFSATEEAINESGKKVPLKKVVVGIDGKKHDSGYSRES